MRIRKAKKEDYEEMRMLWTQTKGMGIRQIEDSKEGIEMFLERNRDTCFVVKEGRLLIGTVLCGSDGRRAYLYHMAVKEEFRGKRIATALLKMVYQELERIGIQKAGVFVFQENECGNKFLEKKGWEKREDIYYYNKMISRF